MIVHILHVDKCINICIFIHTHVFHIHILPPVDSIFRIFKLACQSIHIYIYTYINIHIHVYKYKHKEIPKAPHDSPYLALVKQPKGPIYV
jgi:hypothetical protein